MGETAAQSIYGDIFLHAATTDNWTNLAEN